jgi:hypothetical protein
VGLGHRRIAEPLWVPDLFQLRGEMRAHLALARVAEQPPSSTPTSLLVRTKSGRRFATASLSCDSAWSLELGG